MSKRNNNNSLYAILKKIKLKLNANIWGTCIQIKKFEMIFPKRGPKTQAFLKKEEGRKK